MQLIFLVIILAELLNNVLIGRFLGALNMFLRFCVLQVILVVTPAHAAVLRLAARLG